jgi:hypothetical protein
MTEIYLIIFPHYVGIPGRDNDMHKRGVWNVMPQISICIVFFCCTFHQLAWLAIAKPPLKVSHQVASQHDTCARDPHSANLKALRSLPRPFCLLLLTEEFSDRSLRITYSEEFHELYYYTINAEYS